MTSSRSSSEREHSFMCFLKDKYGGWNWSWSRKEKKKKKSCSCSWFPSNLHPTWQQHTEPRSLSTSPPLSRTPCTAQVLTSWWWVSVVTELSLCHSKCGSRTCRGPRGVSMRCRKQGPGLKSASYYLTGVILSKVWKYTKFLIFDGCTI